MIRSLALLAEEDELVVLGHRPPGTPVTSAMTASIATLPDQRHPHPPDQRTGPVGHARRQPSPYPTGSVAISVGRFVT